MFANLTLIKDGNSKSPKIGEEAKQIKRKFKEAVMLTLQRQPLFQRNSQNDYKIPNLFTGTNKNLSALIPETNIKIKEDIYRNPDDMRIDPYIHKKKQPTFGQCFNYCTDKNLCYPILPFYAIMPQHNETRTIDKA